MVISQGARWMELSLPAHPRKRMLRQIALEALKILGVALALPFGAGHDRRGAFVLRAVAVRPVVLLDGNRRDAGDLAALLAAWGDCGD